MFANFFHQLWSKKSLELWQSVGNISGSMITVLFFKEKHERLFVWDNFSCQKIFLLFFMILCFVWFLSLFVLWRLAHIDIELKLFSQIEPLRWVATSCSVCILVGRFSSENKPIYCAFLTLVAQVFTQHR